MNLAMTFEDVRVSHAPRYAIGRVLVDGQPYLSIPVSNRLVDYEEYYALSEEEFDVFLNDLPLAATFAVRCGRREMDSRLLIAPGSDRGIHA